VLLSCSRPPGRLMRCLDNSRAGLHSLPLAHFLTKWEIRSAMKTDKQHKPFAMIREFQLADWFTLANAVCGTGALFSMLTYLQTTDVRHVYFAGGMVFAALVFDVLDGRVARWRQKSSGMGRELDSLADVISFGVARPLLGMVAACRAYTTVLS